MPSKSAKQHRFMAMCAKNPEKARAKCPPQEVAQEFIDADKAETKKKKPRKAA